MSSWWNAVNANAATSENPSVAGSRAHETPATRCMSATSSSACTAAIAEARASSEPSTRPEPAVEASTRRLSGGITRKIASAPTQSPIGTR